MERERERCKKRWLSEPQPELNYMSLWEVILNERKRLGNPLKDFSINISVTPVSAGSKMETSLDDITAGDTSLVKDLEVFLDYFEKNRVKITPEPLLNKLYGSKMKTIESEEVPMHHIISSLRTILLYYLNWLGVIDTEGDEIVEGMGIFSIKRFWITPVGRKLINRLIEYFIEKGKIKV